MPFVAKPTDIRTKYSETIAFPPKCNILTDEPTDRHTDISSYRVGKLSLHDFGNEMIRRNKIKHHKHIFFCKTFVCGPLPISGIPPKIF